ncbi:MAG: histidine phosphatase family protein [Coleofasciculaceae cyanobacterium RL_1_1]|nr:histidine phosphatase family protein [Coleofasciculaceae cyanobacterium RL_1_1]
MTIFHQTIWIARHGNRLDFVHPEWFNTAARRYDPPLSDDGELQAQQLADRLRTEPIRQIVASPFRRCVQTAYAVAELLDLPIQLEWGICEWLNADWMTNMPETASIAELQAEFPRIDPAYRSIMRPSYPETEPDCLARSGQTARTIADQFAVNQAVNQVKADASSDLLFVGHGATVHGMIWGLQETRDPVKAPLCCLTRIDRDLRLDHSVPSATTQLTTQLAATARLTLTCDTSHLSPTREPFRLN